MKRKVKEVFKNTTSKKLMWEHTNDLVAIMTATTLNAMAVLHVFGYNVVTEVVLTYVIMALATATWLYGQDVMETVIELVHSLIELKND